MNKKSIKLLAGVLIFGCLLTGCESRKAKNYIEQGKASLAKKNYVMALSEFKNAAQEGSKDEEIPKLIKIIENYNNAKEKFDNNQNEEAKNIVSGIDSDYKNYAIKNDIETLSKSISEKEKTIISLNSYIDVCENLVSSGKYDESLDIINKNLTDDKIKGILTTEKYNSVKQLKSKCEEETAKIAAAKAEQEKKNKEAQAKQDEENKINNIINKMHSLERFSGQDIKFERTTEGYLPKDMYNDYYCFAILDCQGDVVMAEWDSNVIVNKNTLKMYQYYPDGKQIPLN